MAVWRNLKAFWRAFRSDAGGPRYRHRGDSIADTVGDLRHARSGPRTDALGPADSSRAGDSAERYTKSFEDDD